MLKEYSIGLGSYVTPVCKVSGLRPRNLCISPAGYGKLGEAGASGEVEEEEEQF